MKIPLSPPGLGPLITNASKEPNKLIEIISLGIKPDPKGKYHHWDKYKRPANPVITPTYPNPKF